MMWREKIGQFIAKEVHNKGAHLERGCKLSFLMRQFAAAPPGQKYIMESFPAGYEMYILHSEGSKGHSKRQDAYLFGKF
jgi:hypothetical protein